MLLLTIENVAFAKTVEHWSYLSVFMFICSTAQTI